MVRILTVLGLAGGLAGLAACATPEPAEVPFSVQRGGPQPFPANYRAELLMFLRSYLNDPTRVREAMIAEPVKRLFGGQERYIVCVRYNARNLSGGYTGASDRMATYLDGRFDRLIENAREHCTGATYVPFPELERLKR